MKVVFIQPKSFFTWEAINIGYMSAYLKKHIKNIDVEFYTEFFDSAYDIVKGCSDADIIGFSVTSPQYKRALELAKLVKTDNNHIVFGGFHPTNIPEIIKEDCIDAVVIGEGEQAMLEICKGNRNQVVNCGYIEDLDSIPFVDREVIKQDRHLVKVEKHFGKRIASILMSRGCPFGCVFCSSKSLWSRKIRLRSPQNILDEMNAITLKYKLDFVSFCDDEIGVNRGHLMEFCGLKILSGNTTKWGCNAVAKCMDRELVSMMKEAGCTEIWMGVESGNVNILKDMNKPNTIEQIKEGFKIVKSAGIKRRSYCILGMPEESFETIKETEDLLDELQPDIVGFTILAPYPGSKFYSKILHSDIDWSDVDEYTNNMTRTNYLTNAQLKSEQKRLTEKYSENLAYRNVE